MPVFLTVFSLETRLQYSKRPRANSGLLCRSVVSFQKKKEKRSRHGDFRMITSCSPRFRQLNLRTSQDAFVVCFVSPPSPTAADTTIQQGLIKRRQNYIVTAHVVVAPFAVPGSNNRVTRSKCAVIQRLSFCASLV